MNRLLLFAAMSLIFIRCTNNSPSKEARESKDFTEVKAKTEFSARIDTISIFSPRSRALEEKAYEMMEKLRKTYDTITIDHIRYYVVEGDLLMDRDELYYFCQQRLQKTDTTIKDTEKTRQLTISTLPNGNFAIWPKGYVIRYAILRNSFHSPHDYEEMVRNMEKATKDWMTACNVRFEYAPGLDQGAVDDDPNPDLTFIVREFNARGTYAANAFFPGDPVFKRKILIDPSFYTMANDKTGVLRHELGHVLGFRHEHIWVKGCTGEDIIADYLGAHQLTPYDCYSVMHYPCNNCGTKDMTLSDFDIVGARKIYGPPSSQPLTFKN